MREDQWKEHAPVVIPADESERLEALLRYESFDVEPVQDESFNRLAKLAAKICGLPIGLINLIGRDKQFNKACFGFTGSTTSRDESFCQFTIMQDEILEVPDARKHPYFKYNPNLYNELKLVFYAGVPLKTPDGFNIGSLCLIDHKPNRLTDEQREMIKTLADEVIAQYELNLARNQLEELNKEKDELLQVVSHDMRNPLMGIIGFSGLLKNEVDSEEHREILRLIEESGSAIMGIVNVLLKTNYLKGGGFTIHREKSNITELTKEVVTLLRATTQLKKQKLILNSDKNIEANVDPGKWKQIVGNIISNASKFTPEKGEIRVSVRRSSGGGEIELEVADNGIGMSDSILKNLFSGKAEIQREGTAGEETSGIGMRVIQKYVHLHNGKVDVKSEENKGTTFRVSIPG